jgi:hypothetical protein
MVFRTDAAIHRPNAKGYVSLHGLPSLPATMIEEQRELMGRPKGKPYEIHCLPH